MENRVENYVIVKPGDTYYSIYKKTGVPVETLQTLNGTPNESLQIGQKLITGYKTTNQSKASASDVYLDTQKKYALTTANNPIQKSQTINRETATKTPIGTTKNASLAEYEKHQPVEYKPLVSFLTKEEGRKEETYIGPDGHAHVGIGHKLKREPSFIAKIRETYKTTARRKEELEKALKNHKNRTLLKESLEADLSDAIKQTGLKGVSSKIDIKTLKLSDEQIKTLLAADIETARNRAHKFIGKNIFENRKSNEKLVALDLFFNSGGNAPKFIAAFKKGDMVTAQFELDNFHSKQKDKNGKEIGRTYFIGLIKRNYKRMLIIRNNDIKPKSKNKLVKALNLYLRQTKAPTVKTFKEAEAILKQP